MHTKNTYAEGHAIMVNKPERAHLGEGAPETVCEMNSSLCPEVTTANQRLFVAAPDLLAALQDLLHVHGCSHDCAVCDEARAAIALARRVSA